MFEENCRRNCEACLSSNQENDENAEQMGSYTVFFDQVNLPQSVNKLPNSAHFCSLSLITISGTITY
jgi:hypothetical protein